MPGVLKTAALRAAAARPPPGSASEGPPGTGAPTSRSSYGWSARPICHTIGLPV